MNEPNLPQRAGMMLKTLASTIGWVSGLLVTLVGGKLREISGRT